MFKKDSLFFEKLEQSIGYLYVIDEETFSIVYMCEAMASTYREANCNGRCFEILHGRTIPCAFCPQSAPEQKSIRLDGYLSDKKKWFQYKMIGFSAGEEKYRIVHMDEVENMMRLGCEAISQISDYKSLYEENVRIKNQLLYDALHDGMTGVYNKASYLRDVKQVALLKQSFGIIVCDINNLKHINDSVGHITGDKTIRTASRILKSAENEKTRCYRIGGDEFAVLQTPSDEAVIAKLAVEIDKQIKKYCNNKFSVAIGWAYGKAEDNFKAIFKKADREMYKDKARQKNGMENCNSLD